MRIIVIKNKNRKNSYTTCIHSLIEEIGQRNGYQITFTDSLNVGSDAKNTITFLTLPQASFINKFLQQQRLKSFLNKNKVDLLIQNADFTVKRKIIPQILIVNDIDLLTAVNKLSFPKIFLLTYSQVAKHTISDKGFNDNIYVIPFFASAIFQPINWSMKQQVKINYTEGSEYFFASQPLQTIDDIIQLLKAFSGFKKWQQSSMKLILAGKLLVPQGEWESRLNTYKYREDVLVYHKLPEEEKAKLLAGAYACIHLPKKDNDLLPLIQSIQCHTPIITIETTSVKEYIANTGLIISNNYEDITKQMILMYKDENLRNKLQENCIIEADKFSKENALQSLQTALLQTSKDVEL